MNSAITGRLTCTVPEAAQILGIGRDAAYRAAADGSIPTLRLGRRIVVPVPKLLALLGVSDTPQHSESASATDAPIATTNQASKEPSHGQYAPGALRSA